MEPAALEMHTKPNSKGKTTGKQTLKLQPSEGALPKTDGKITAFSFQLPQALLHCSPQPGGLSPPEELCSDISRAFFPLPSTDLDAASSSAVVLYFIL